MSEKEKEKEIELDNIVPTYVPTNETKQMTSHPVLGHLPDISKELNPGASPADIVNFIVNKPGDELIPWEDCILPSRGVYYDGMIPDGKVQVRSMTMSTDKILATARLTQSGQAIDYVFRKCVKFPTQFDPLDLLNGDRVYLLFYLRGITHGNNYEFMVTCTNDACKLNSTHEYDLNQLSDNIKLSKFQKEPIKVILPYFTEITKREVYVEVRFLRGRDSIVINQRRQIKEKIVGAPVKNANTGKTVSVAPITIDDAIEENLNLVIVSANGVRDRHTLAQFISRMHGKDTAVVREFLRDNAPGIDLDLIVTCPHCDNAMKMELPFSENFFRPKDPGGM